MQTYDSYKDSGEQWLGNIPSHWEIRRTKYLWKETDERSEYGSEQLLSVSQYDGVRESKEESRSESLAGYKIVHQDELVINIMLAWLGGLGVSRYEGIVSPAYCVYKLFDKQNPRYLHYLYRTPLYLAEFARHSTGIVPSRWRMYTDDFGDVLTILPPVEEQNRMVAYLDEQTSQIDEAIAQQQNMIDLLNERKQIIINEAVTKGLNPNVPMKDSGVDWIGMIPENWEIGVLKYLGSTRKCLIDCEKLKNLEVHDYSMPAYDEGKRPECISGNSIESTKLSISKPTLLINKLNVHKKRIWYIEKPLKNSVASTEFVPIELVHINPQFVELYLSSSSVTNYLQIFANGATNSQKRVSPDIILNLKVLVPSAEEQSSIVKTVKESFIPIDKEISMCESLIQILRERKQIIINEVVTGKIKV